MIPDSYYEIKDLKNQIKDLKDQINKIKSGKKSELINFLEWINEMAEELPMVLNTCNEDIVEIYLNGLDTHYKA